MAPLAADRKYRTRATERTNIIPVAAATKLYQGGLVSRSATGFGKPASNTAGEAVVGFSLAGVDNSAGADGALSGQISTGVLKLDNDVAHPITQANVGGPCYVLDDNTVCTNAGGALIAAGVVDSLDADGSIWVMVDPMLGAAAALGETGDADVVTPDNNAAAGEVWQHVFVIADAATGDHDIVVAEKFEVLGATVIKNGAGAANTAQVQTGAGVAISDAIAAAVDKAVTYAGTIDATTPTNIIAAGGTLRVHVVRAAGSGAMKVIVTGRKAA